MERTHALPIHPSFKSDDDFLASILHFANDCQIFQTICGGVHILDFLTKDPDLYHTVLPPDWCQWFDDLSVTDVIDFLLHDELAYDRSGAAPVACHPIDPSPPDTLMKYVREVRCHTLLRAFQPHDEETGKLGISREVALGMNAKKKIEVESFSRYINRLTKHIEQKEGHPITNIMDFGAGQNYLGRALASPPFEKRVVALESRAHNVAGAKSLDSKAGLRPRQRIHRNKKDYRQALAMNASDPGHPRSTKSDNDALCAINDHDRDGKAILYLEKVIDNGDLTDTIDIVKQTNPDPSILVVGLHACGNLTHHGLRSLILNPSVKAVSLVGCCYNLLTERTGPASFKFPALRYNNLRLEKASSAFDPHGFPMSERLANVPSQSGHGISLNITARSMACQAPHNWTDRDCQSFFTRNFYRALLQRILFDCGILRPHGVSCRGSSRASDQPVVIGSLRKAAYASFPSYVRGAAAKLRQFATLDEADIDILDKMSEDELRGYEVEYAGKKKELSIIWSLMAFSAGVVESLIVTDRWQFLREQRAVKSCWVDTVFDSHRSPRNFCVVGIKR